MQTKGSRKGVMATSQEKRILNRESLQLSQEGASDTKRDTSKALKLEP